MDDALTLINCLSASLTILTKLEVIDLQETEQIIKETGHTGLFDLLNEKFQEIEGGRISL